ncbi:cupin domain-containing protein [Hymenobacter cavernae]|uniref:Cupin type-2 domain-containing protein n=1 Tax=Hymenobacter cavernae TaxID=2044852 RepID=A0ABQ1UK06_9BACT|nr:cupin domain-containing protein [Hymenobacter cavernae]GGF20029.1 hypothetical protein GCM10011383_34550 [Hymenobacter cavernae]
MTLLNSFATLGANVPAPGSPFVVRGAEGRFAAHYRIMGFDLYLKLSGRDTQEQVSVFTGVYRRHDGPPLHVHYQQDEEFYILEGEFLVQVGEEKYTLKAGDLIFLPRNIPHGFLVLSETAKMLFLTQPSGTTEAFFQQLSRLGSTASLEQVQQLHLAHNLKIVGPRVRAG